MFIVNILIFNSSFIAKIRVFLKILTAEDSQNSKFIKQFKISTKQAFWSDKIGWERKE